MIYDTMIMKDEEAKPNIIRYYRP